MLNENIKEKYAKANASKFNLNYTHSHLLDNFNVTPIFIISFIHTSTQHKFTQILINLV